MKPASNPILLAGGTGAIGRLTANALRNAYPEWPLLIGGRDLAKCREAAAEIGNAEGVVIDVDADDLGLGDLHPSAVAVFYSDNRLATLRFAHGRGIPHLGISSGIYEIAPEVATFILAPGSAAIVLGYEWLVGATTIAALACSKAFGRVREISIGALVDDQDLGGPAVAEDFKKLSRMMPAAFTLSAGAYTWRSDDEAQAEFFAIDGTKIQAAGFSSIDVVGLAAATGAPNVEFNMATAVSSSRRRGEAKSTEIIITLSGEDQNGDALTTRHAVYHPGGAAPLTAIGTSMILGRLAGSDGKVPTPPGLYFPFQVLDHAAYLSQLKVEGGGLIALDPS